MRQHVCLCTLYVSSVLGDLRRILDPLKWELWMVVSCHMGARNRTEVLWSSEREISSLNH